jgi:dimethylhistidine N-methyltransferase
VTLADDARRYHLDGVGAPSRVLAGGGAGGGLGAFGGGSAAAGGRPAVVDDEQAEEVLRGLSAAPKRVPSKYLYDEAGSRLFERITRLPEYYLSRAEIEILETHGAEIADRLGRDCLLVEFGSGHSRKTQILLAALDSPVAYVPIDVSPAPLARASAALAEEFPGLEILPVVGDFTAPLDLPRPARAPRRVVAYDAGSTLGNLHPSEAVAFLARAHALVGAAPSRGALLVGIDLHKNVANLLQAYDDPSGVNAAFDLNLLARFNRELDATFELDHFAHHAAWDPRAGRIETHLVSLVDQTVWVAGHPVSFARGESIRTAVAYKYDLESFAALAERAGLRTAAVWTDAAGLFSLHLLY